VSADCKGIVIRGQGTPTVCGGERPEGQRANQKRMAAVGVFCLSRIWKYASVGLA
jgi:hypothetical protein